jgi:hypothetical protein
MGLKHLEEHLKGTETMNQNTLRKLVVSEWITLDGVFDADTMDQWWIPYDSVERQA